MNLSLKGIARWNRGPHIFNSEFSVLYDFFVAQDRRILDRGGSLSLRSKLEFLAREEHSFWMHECIYWWKAAFDQIWTHIRIRIKLDPDDDVSEATMDNCKTRWRNGIHNKWNNRWGCGRSGELTCRLTFEVVWVNSDEHHEVQVRRGPEQSSVCTWDTNDTGDEAAHEFGHMIGLVDEYRDPDCPARLEACTLSSPDCTGTIMDHNQNNVPSRMMTRFANNIGSNVVAI